MLVMCIKHLAPNHAMDGLNEWYVITLATSKELENNWIPLIVTHLTRI